MSRRCGARRWRSTTALGAAVAAPLVAAALGQAREGAPSTTARVSLLADRTASDLLSEPSSLRVTVAGTDVAVDGIEPVERWEIVVAIDPALSRDGSGEAAATLFGERIDRLVETGSVGLVVIDSWVDEVVTPAGDSAALAAAIAEIPRLGTFGQIESLRAEAGASTSTDERRALARRELRLVRWQREALFDWLLDRPGAGPRALFLLADGYDGRLGAAYGLDEPELDPSADPVLDRALLGPTLAAAGWTVFPLRPTEPTTDPSGAPLAEATGGHPIRQPADLDRALELLSGARRIELALSGPPSLPLPLEIVPARPLPGSSRVSSPRWVTGGLVPGLGASRARRLLTLDDSGELDVEAALHREGPDPASVFVEVSVALGAMGERPPTSAWLSPALYIERLDAVPLQIDLRGRGEPLGGIDRWVAQVALPLPVDAVELVAVVSDLHRGVWGAARLEEGAGRLARSGPGRVVEPFDLRPATSDGEAAEVSAETTTIVLLAPEGGRLDGRRRFRTLVTTPAIRRAEFYLDGELVESDDAAPFAARIDLGREVARHTVEVRGYDSAGNLLGTDSIRLNEPFRSLDVSIADLAVDPASSTLRLAATVEHPTDLAIERVEYYHNEELLGASTAPPWSFEGVTGAIGSTDYVRAVAYFDDGRFLEDVRLVSSPGSVEEVEVNLVQVYVVATDEQGEPVADLDIDDFRIRLRGEPQTIERFAYADEVPLELALVIDTSPSMWPLMPDTRKAAARFLTQVVGETDRALVVDFDTRPRVAHPLSGDLGDLLVSLGGLEAEKQGTTALYDSVIFAALELPAGQQRKAVVLLTDGDDYKSRFSLGRAIDTAKQAGVPVYVVSLAGIQDPRRQFRRTDLDALTGETGGEAYYLAAVAELAPTYDEIARELRSQYLLAFPTTRQLSEEDFDSIELDVARRGLELRTVVGGRSVN